MPTHDAVQSCALESGSNHRNYMLQGMSKPFPDGLAQPSPLITSLDRRRIQICLQRLQEDRVVCRNNCARQQELEDRNEFGTTPGVAIRPTGRRALLADV